MPADVGGYQADEQIITGVLAQIARGYTTTGWMCTIILAANNIPAVLSDEVSDEVSKTPDLKISTAIAPTAHAVVVDGRYRVTGEWLRNTAGSAQQLVHRRLRGRWEEDAGMRPDADADARRRRAASGLLARRGDGRNCDEHHDRR
jgi:3-hydroxy-9,10-secoandrosta-1,3,5(10)-triene-9,17-dione monooxygenase